VVPAVWPDAARTRLPSGVARTARQGPRCGRGAELVAGGGNQGLRLGGFIRRLDAVRRAAHQPAVSVDTRPAATPPSPTWPGCAACPHPCRVPAPRGTPAIAPGSYA